MTTHAVLSESAYWQILRPGQALTEGHLALRPKDGAPIDRSDVATDLLHAYRTCRAGLHAALGCDGFGVSFAWSWVPRGDGIGEPRAEWDQPTIHVFGRAPNERVKPVRVMALPAHERVAALPAPERMRLDCRLATAFAAAGADAGPGPDLQASPADCDGCVPEVARDQELWRADEVRVIRPRRPLTEANLLVLPMRHVASPASLLPDEVLSYARRLREVRAYFAGRFGSTGLSCFLNDGARAGQETPHVHVHVFGRSADESRNPFEVLARRIGIRSTP
ncbi:HIT family protein [Actinopolymorpha singaporensis]|uniref:HIT domain-containing protein n=1 Tax=Actinopolymorpha singaporensis TaxID=117157 RepID=A0A1H1RNI1_9ACTN|nr:HIT domain-containing protein [Actinopolymorpha singaporensis]SDS37258.1 HIT domain-containing protein [Actinopolymorpha singaporensis]